MQPRSVQDQIMHREPSPYLRGELVVVIDCSDLDRSAHFWTGVLGYVRDGVATGRYQSLLPADGQGAEVLLQFDPELHRLLRLGARALTEEPVSEAGWRWHILADPDGNEFCVLQPPASYWPD